MPPFGFGIKKFSPKTIILIRSKVKRRLVNDLIPLIILNALDGKTLPIYGDGKQVSDWLYVDDHARALYKVVTEGELGETYNIGGFNEKQNIEVVNTICNQLNELISNKPDGLNDFPKPIRNRQW